MDSSRLLASDSFSYSWLSAGNSTPKPNQIHEDDPEDFMFNINHVDYHGSLSLEIDQYPSFSARRIIRIHDYDHQAENFNFDVRSTISADLPSMSSTSTTSTAVFSNGFIMPEAATDNIDNTSSTDTSATTTRAHDHPQQNWSPSSSSSSFSSVSSSPSIMVPSCFRKLGKSSRKVLARCLSGIFTSYEKGSAADFIASRRSIRVDDLNRRVQEVNKSWRSAAAKPIIPSSSSSSPPSPRISTTTCSVSADWSDSECSVYEAIMYCKRSSTGL